MSNVMVLSSCDEWKSYSSARIIGVFDDEDTLKEEIFNMFLNSEIEWKEADLKTLKKHAEEEYYNFGSTEDYYSDEEDSDSDEEEIELIFKENKDQIFKEIKESSISEIHSHANYIMIQEFAMNEIN